MPATTIRTDAPHERSLAREQPVEPRDADVVERLEGRAERLGRQPRFLRDGEVRRPRRHDEDVAARVEDLRPPSAARRVVPDRAAVDLRTARRTSGVRA